MSEKRQADVGDLIDLLVATRDLLNGIINEIDVFVNKVGTEVLAPATVKEIPAITGEVDKLAWEPFQTKKGQTWERLNLAQGFGGLGELKKNLANACMFPEATIETPYIANEKGYWIFKNVLYRRPMKTPK